MFQINNLSVKTTDNQILQNINLTIGKGEVHVLMGPNGSGKSSLAKVIIGHPDYIVTDGNINLENVEINDLNATDRSKLGIFLAFQSPVEVPGVNFSNFLRLVYNSHQPKDKQLPVFKFRRLLKEKASSLEISEKLLDRNLHENLSGGEKKKMEILQLALLSPKLGILDEIDSGLDTDALKTVFQNLNTILQADKDISLLIITHNQRIFDYLDPKFVHIIYKGKIVKDGNIDLVKDISKNGYTAYAEKKS